MPYDLVIIGSGPGGYPAAIRAGQYGLRTALVEKDPKLGGTCLHVGCIPTKSLLHTADIWEEIQNGKDSGILCDNPHLDYPRAIERKDEIVARHAKGIEFLMKKNKVDWIRGYGTLKGSKRVEIRNGKGIETLETENIIIATGSEARMLPGLEADPDFVLTNIEILNLRNIPRKLAIVGAGAVGVEFGSIFNRFGTEVTILELLPRIVPLEDEEVSKELRRAFRKSGIRVETEAKVENIQKNGKGVQFSVTLANGKREDMEADKILIAVGRKPKVENIGLESINVEIERGFIKVNRWMETAEQGVYAIGDVVLGSPQLAHVATMEGLVAVAHIAGKPAKPVNPRRIPNVTFTEPNIGSAGLTEAQARAQGYQVKVGKFPFMANTKSSILGHHEGFVKIVADEKFGEILGVHIIGSIATELIAEAVAAMEAEATVDTLRSTIHPHPTVSEAVGDAFNAVDGLAINA